MRKYRNIKYNLQPRRVTKYSEEYIQYRKARGTLSVKAELCDTDSDGFEDAIVRDWRSPALKKQQICKRPPLYGPTNLTTQPQSGPTNLESVLLPGATDSLTALPDVPGTVEGLTAAGEETTIFTPEFSQRLFGTHAAMDESGSLDHLTGNSRFVDGSSLGVTTPGSAIDQWRVEYSGIEFAGVQGQLSFDSGIYGVELTAENYDFVSVTSSASRNSSSITEQIPEAYIFVMTLPNVGGEVHDFISSSTVQEIPLFNTLITLEASNPTNMEEHLKLTLTNGGKDLTYSVRGSDDAFQSVTITDFTTGPDSAVSRFMVTLQLGEASVAQNSLSLNGGSTIQQFNHTGFPANVINKSWGGDSIDKQSLIHISAPKRRSAIS